MSYPRGEEPSIRGPISSSTGRPESNHGEKDDVTNEDSGSSGGGGQGSGGSGGGGGGGSGGGSRRGSGRGRRRGQGGGGSGGKGGGGNRQGGNRSRNQGNQSQGKKGGGRSRRRRGKGSRGGGGGHEHVKMTPDPDRPLDEYLGILERLGNGAGFVRRKEHGYTPSDDDIYVSPNVIGKYDLRSGDEICGQAGTPPRPGKSAPLRHLHSVNGLPPEDMADRPRFSTLSALHPNRQLILECGLERNGRPDYTNRIIDLICPLGVGQRALIVSPAKAGKTMVLQAIAEGISKNKPDAKIYILLVDERPEEVTEMESTGLGEVVASSFDYPAERHVQVAEITLERARRAAELGQDVVLILDSITRLARAYNTTQEGSGRTLTGGIVTLPTGASIRRSTSTRAPRVGKNFSSTTMRFRCRKRCAVNWPGMPRSRRWARSWG